MPLQQRELLRERSLFHVQSTLLSGLLETLFIERMEQNEDIFARFTNEQDFRVLVSERVSQQVYARLKRGI